MVCLCISHKLKNIKCLIYTVTAFQSLQSVLPAVPPSTKLSKLDILLMASAYIGHLKRLVDDDSNPGTSQPSSESLTVFHPVKVAYHHLNLRSTAYKLTKTKLRRRNGLWDFAFTLASATSIPNQFWISLVNKTKSRTIKLMITATLICFVELSKNYQYNWTIPRYNSLR